MRPSTLAIPLGLFILAGCASTHEIETSPPRPRTVEDAQDAAAAREAPLSVAIARGETVLPEDVALLRFRISEVQLHRSEGGWIRLPSDATPIEFVRGASAGTRPLIDTRVAPGTYDSLAITFADVFVRFGENAGGPLAASGERPQRLRLRMDPEIGRRTAVTLTLEPGASVTRSPDCRWFFVPLLHARVTTAESRSPAGR